MELRGDWLPEQLGVRRAISRLIGIFVANTILLVANTVLLVANTVLLVANTVLLITGTGAQVPGSDL